MERSERTRGISFTALLIMLLVQGSFTLVVNLAMARVGEGLSLSNIGFSTIFLVSAAAALKWKRWGMYGLAGFGLLFSIVFAIQGNYVGLVMPLIALLAVLISVLTGEWGGME